MYSSEKRGYNKVTTTAQVNNKRLLLNFIKKVVLQMEVIVSKQKISTLDVVCHSTDANGNRGAGCGC